MARLVETITDSERSSSATVRRFFIVAFTLTWSIGGIGLVIGRIFPGRPFSTSSALYYLAAYSVSLTGIVFTAHHDGRQGLRHLAQRLNPLNAPAASYVIVVAGYAAIAAAALLAGSAYHHTPLSLPSARTVFTVLVVTLVRDPGPVGEEFGWRGFALPRLAERYSPLEASVRLGLVHAAWHIPLFFIPGQPQAQMSFPLFTIGVVALSVFNTALYLRTRANLLLAILVHLLGNVAGGFAVDAHALNFQFLAEGAAAVIVVLAGGLKA